MGRSSRPSPFTTRDKSVHFLEPSKTKAATKSFTFQHFTKAVKKIIGVSKAELDKREASYQQERAAKKASRYTKLKTLAILAFCCLSLQPAQADPEERAQIVKARLLQKLVMNGWQLINETHSLLIMEKPMTGWGAPLVQALTTGANGTSPVYRLSLTIIPDSDHFTSIPFTVTINSQNVFGQTKAIPVTNKNAQEYVLGMMKAASEGLPAKYKFIPPQGHQ
jgi:hypothetical protein